MNTNKSQRVKPSMLVLSHVLPFPRSSGQQQRVYYKLKAFRDFFHLTFLTYAAAERHPDIREKLKPLCDKVILLPSKSQSSYISRILYRVTGSLYIMRTGLKFSNYAIGEVEFNPKRLTPYLMNRKYHLALYEYWHAVNSVNLLHHQDVPCVLDMHDILWKSYAIQLENKHWLPKVWKRFSLSKYKEFEQNAWRQFDGLIAINQDELEYACNIVNPFSRMFFAPMGTDMERWPYSWDPAAPPRLVFYGGLGSAQNQQSALVCYEQIMPLIWEQFPEAELWLVGSNPPEKISALSQNDTRVYVTGYIERVQDILNSMTAVFCPWTGAFGFRSRLIEVMALGVPVIASPDAVVGMDLIEGEGIHLGQNSEQIAEKTLGLLNNSDFCGQQSRLAREQVEQSFSLEQTYGKLAQELYDWVLVKASNPA